MLHINPTSSLRTTRRMLRIPDTLLLADLALVAAQLGKKRISFANYRKHGRFCPEVYCLRFGSWRAALKLVRCEPARLSKIPNEDILNDLQRVARRFNSTSLSISQYHRLGKYSTSVPIRRFDLWQLALAAAGLKAGRPRRIFPRPNRGSRETGIAMRFAVLRRDCFKCVTCGRSPTSDPTVILEIDHIIPWSAGGSSTMENLRTLCKQCNRGKSDSVATVDSQTSSIGKKTTGPIH